MLIENSVLTCDEKIIFKSAVFETVLYLAQLKGNVFRLLRMMNYQVLLCYVIGSPASAVSYLRVKGFHEYI